MPQNVATAAFKLLQASVLADRGGKLMPFPQELTFRHAMN